MLALELSDTFLDELTARVAERVSAQVHWRDIEGTANAFEVPVSTIRSWRERGCPAVRVGKRLMFDLREVERWLSEQ